MTYAWYSSADNYTTAIATGASYQVKESDEGFKIEVVATTTNDNGTTVSATSTATAAVLDAAPTVTTPTISGTAQEDQTLTASASSGQSDNAVTYAWYSSADNYTTAIATGASYQVKESRRGLQDRGGGDHHQRQRRHRVGNQHCHRGGARCGADGDDADDQRHGPGRPDADGIGEFGTIRQCRDLRGWYSSADNYTTAIATGASYQVKESDEGFKIEVVATTTNDNGATVSQTSTATAAVLDAAPTVTTPTISGTAQESQTLTASASSGQSDNTVSYQWMENSGSGGYLPEHQWRHRRQLSGQGERRDLQDRGGGDHHQRQRRDGVTTSTATAAVLDAAPTVTTPTITGTAQEGQTLTASASSGQSDNTVSYQWMENSGSGGTYQNISGATAASYQVKESDETFKIEVVATTTNDNGATVSQTSAATAAVLDAAPTVTTPALPARPRKARR